MFQNFQCQLYLPFHFFIYNYTDRPFRNFADCHYHKISDISDFIYTLLLIFNAAFCWAYWSILSCRQRSLPCQSRHAVPATEILRKMYRFYCASIVTFALALSISRNGCYFIASNFKQDIIRKYYLLGFDFVTMITLWLFRLPTLPRWCIKVRKISRWLQYRLPRPSTADTLTALMLAISPSCPSYAWHARALICYIERAALKYLISENNEMLALMGYGLIKLFEAIKSFSSIMMPYLFWFHFIRNFLACCLHIWLELFDGKIHFISAISFRLPFIRWILLYFRANYFYLSRFAATASIYYRIRRLQKFYADAAMLMLCLKAMLMTRLPISRRVLMYAAYCRHFSALL